MHSSDRVYGDITITDPLILALLQTTPLQRLRRVNQYGGVNLVYPDRFQVSRFEHSIGVWHVLRQLGLPLEIQLAGLLHDIGHTAFSHMVDQAMESTSEDFHEEFAHAIPGMDEVNVLLTRANLVLQPLEHYPEIKPASSLVGADRLDYAMRDDLAATNARSDLGTRVLRQLQCAPSRDLCFTDMAVAREFADASIRSQWNVIYAPEVAVVYQALTEMLRMGLRSGWLTHDDLWTDDATVMKLLAAHATEFPTHYRLFADSFTVAPGTAADHDFRHVKLKIRLLDPPVQQGTTIAPLSHWDTDFAQALAKAREEFLARTEGAYFRVQFS